MSKSAQAWLLFALACVLYGNTLSFGFALDDKIVITHNQFTKKGLDGIGDIFSNDSMTGFFGVDKKLLAGGRYRPLSMATHAIEWEFFRDNPFIYHLVNVLMYALTVYVLFLFLSNLFRAYIKDDKQWYLQLPFLVCLIWLIHPLHTEAVANVKGRDEIMSVLGGIAAMHFYLNYWDNQKKKDLIIAILCFFGSLLSKESSIVLIAVFPLALFFFREAPLKRLLRPTSVFVLTGLAYIALRFVVLGSAKLDSSLELMNNPFINASGTEKIATLFLTYILYFKLLIFPHPLTHDYYPKHIPIVDFSDPLVLLSVLIHIGLLVVLLRNWKKWPLLSFGILLYFISFSLYSNIVFNIGTFMNERFLYLPSLGFAVILGAFVARSKVNVKLIPPLLVVFVLLSSWKTIDRNFAWENDFTLATTDVLTSSESAKAQMGAGSALLEAAQAETNPVKKKELLQSSMEHLYRSIQIHKTYFPPMILMGNALAEAERWEESLAYYENCLKLKPGDKDGMNNLEYVGQKSAQNNLHSTSVKAYNMLLKQSPQLRYYNALGELYGKNMGDLNATISIVSQGLERFPNDADLLQKLGVAKAMQGKTIEALKLFQTALNIKPESARLHLNVGVAYQNLGRKDSADYYLQKALEIEPELRFN